MGVLGAGLAGYRSPEMAEGGSCGGGDGLGGAKTVPPLSGGVSEVPFSSLHGEGTWDTQEAFSYSIRVPELKGQGELFTVLHAIII